MAFCLSPKIAEKFKEKLIKREIDPVAFSQMSSEERRTKFSEIVGEENAHDVNRLFESKLLLKNQQRGLINWVKEVSGMKEQPKRDLLSKIQKMSEILTPESEKTFFEDLAEHRLGVGVSFEEAKTINDLATKATEAEEVKNKMFADNPDYDISKETDAEKTIRMAYGEAQVDLDSYVSDLKKEANRTTWQDFKNRPLATVGKGILGVQGQSKGINAAFDNSAIFRQGWKTMLTNPVIWQRNARRTFSDIKNTFGENKVERALKADILSRPTYDLMKKAKLDVGVSEEEFPSALPEKIPGIGRIYKASENAYSGFVKRQRADIFDKYINIAKKLDVNLNNDELLKISKMVNALTGRGDLGKLESAGVINSVFFSPKFMKSHIDVVLQPITGGAKLGDKISGEDGGSKFVRRESLKNLIKMTVGMAFILGFTKWLAGDKLELDPRSSDFGKLRIGDTRFDLTGGAGSVAVLAARMVSGQMKSTATGEIAELNAISKNGNQNPMSKTRLELMEEFFENKASPLAGVMVDMMKGHTRSGYPMTKDTALGFAGREAINLFTPLPAKNIYENLSNQNSAPLLLNILADGTGIAANTYSSEKDLSGQIRESKKKDSPEETKRLEEARKQIIEEKKQNNPVLIARQAKVESENEKYPELKELRNQVKAAREKKDYKVSNLINKKILDFKKANGIK